MNGKDKCSEDDDDDEDIEIDTSVNIVRKEPHIRNVSKIRRRRRRRNSVNRTLGTSPYQVVFGKKPPVEYNITHSNENVLIH